MCTALVEDLDLIPSTHVQHHSASKSSCMHIVHLNSFMQAPMYAIVDESDKDLRALGAEVTGVCVCVTKYGSCERTASTRN